MAKIKRALALSGGGPVAGIEIGALKAFEEKGIEFDVFTCDCIGSWVGAIYNGLKPEAPNKWEYVKTCFESFFLPDDIYQSFPIMRGFVVDYMKTAQKMIEKMADPSTYQKLFLPERILEYFMLIGQSLPIKDTDTFNDLITRGLSVNPMARLMVELGYKISKTGISSQATQPNFIKNTIEKMIDFQQLFLSKKTVYINAYNLTQNKIQNFINRNNHVEYKPITPYVMGAASTILYYIENQVIDGEQFCEGAVQDTVNFKDLLKNHPDLEEIWVIKITDYKTIKPPKNILEAALLQVMVPFDTIADDDIKLFKYHLKEEGKDIKLIEVKMKYQDVTYDWSYSNLYRGIEVGYKGTLDRIQSYELD